MAVAVNYLTPGDDVWPNGANSSGNDFIGGADGNDTLSGGLGDDHLYGGEGDDRVFGGVGSDDLYGYDGDDGLYGGGGADIFFGGGGGDFIAGNGGADKLYGDDGGDTLVGDGGNDLLTGGAGADTFLFYSNATGADRIADFENGVDHISFSGVVGVDAFSDLVVTTVSGVARITLPDGSTITLTGMTAGQVDASDFIFGP